jgi:hypothetical protein
MVTKTSSAIGLKLVDLASRRMHNELLELIPTIKEPISNSRLFSLRKLQKSTAAARVITDFVKTQSELKDIDERLQLMHGFEMLNNVESIYDQVQGPITQTQACIVLDSFIRLKSISNMERVMKHIDESSIKMDVPLFRLYLKALAKMRKFEKICQLCQDMDSFIGYRKDPNVVSILAQALAETGNLEQAKLEIESFISSGLKLSFEPYARTIRLCYVFLGPDTLSSFVNYAAAKKFDAPIHLLKDFFLKYKNQHSFSEFKWMLSAIDRCDCSKHEMFNFRNEIYIGFDECEELMASYQLALKESLIPTEANYHLLIGYFVSKKMLDLVDVMIKDASNNRIVLPERTYKMVISHLIDEGLKSKLILFLKANVISGQLYSHVISSYTSGYESILCLKDVQPVLLSSSVLDAEKYSLALDIMVQDFMSSKLFEFAQNPIVLQDFHLANKALAKLIDIDIFEQYNGMLKLMQANGTKVSSENLKILIRKYEIHVSECQNKEEKKKEFEKSLLELSEMLKIY